MNIVDSSVRRSFSAGHRNAQTFAVSIADLADSMMYPTARHYLATLWTQDSDFKDLAQVKYFP